ncbi:MAG TPA: hypothetical protein PLO93_05605 [Candidatus Omnitrophota bacterium]|nr:hypothetical protein [Candidatus Omnitrophota bacterium]HQL41746.1 hypothetical protein [Candidatus Omnitrophota bacterium]
MKEILSHQGLKSHDYLLGQGPDRAILQRPCERAVLVKKSLNEHDNKLHGYKRSKCACIEGADIFALYGMY